MGSRREELLEHDAAGSGGAFVRLAVALAAVVGIAGTSLQKGKGKTKRRLLTEPSHRGYPVRGSGFGSAFCGPRETLRVYKP
jgi:hypothetical protein